MSRATTAPPRPLAALLDDRAAEGGDRVAIAEGDRQVTYGELRARADGVAAALVAAGIRPGDAVAMLLEDGSDWVAAFFGVLRAGAVAAPLSVRLKRPELQLACRDAGVRAVVSAGGARDAAAALARRAGVNVAEPVVVGAVAKGATAPAAVPAGAGAAAVVHWSSGSTGRAKRVPRTHAALAAEAASVVEGLELRADDRIFCAIPMTHAYGLGCAVLAAVASGATLVLEPAARPLPLQRERVLAAMERERVTVFPAVPFLLRLLADAPGGGDLSSLRLCLSAATALPRSTFDAFDRAFGVAPRQLYGTTETGTIAANAGDDPYADPASVGAPLPGAEVRVLDAAGDELEPGRIGELVVRTPGMTAGYADREELNRTAFRDGFFRTGDRGRVDAAGRIVVTGRSKLLIDVRGSDKVDPVEVEDVIAVHPFVREVVVVGAESGVDGEQLVRAVVVADGPCREIDLVRWCREHLAEYKVPRQVAFVDEIPHGPDGKLLRKYLV